VFGYMTIERGGTRGGWFFFFFSFTFVQGISRIVMSMVEQTYPFYSVNLHLNTFYMDVSRSVVEIR
jgi:hypothetical protein